ncbi:hypothetical protein RND71_017232 [Anisodus tanguticus]|uniref:Uncharacterized protein n=1 Tax=Anisodus tanguticus TaxID=243964 RepID=A0AAE1VFU0_9SOLA|nr:hypothetical protein RND71_017232 [Anisodus tanguticus]
MQCSEETIARLFYNVSSSFQLFLVFSYFTSILLAKLFYFLGGNPFFWKKRKSCRNRDNAYGFAEFSDEENEYYHDDAETKEENHYVACIFPENEKNGYSLNSTVTDEGESIYGSPASQSDHSDDEDVEEKILNSVSYNCDLDKMDNDINHGIFYRKIMKDKKVKESKKICREENFLVYAPSKLERKKFRFQEKENNNVDEILGDSYSVGSTSKSSSEWRSSIKDSGDDPFTSSSRRSCPKWESYTVFQKYDEEMLFLDRISVQKLHETESLRSIQSCPRSISDRIVHKLATKNRKSSDFRHNPYHELEAAYVAQVCLAWEALSWNYKYFKSLRASRVEEDPGCPSYVAQHFQQFQVLLQRYVENEPYEHGKRPEIYARMRCLAPKLLQVPEYRGKCRLAGKRRLKEEEEMEILMGLVDLKVVSRVLRMSEVNDEQLHWCEDKMSKVRVSDGKLLRDASPLFFPAHIS